MRRVRSAAPVLALLFLPSPSRAVPPPQEASEPTIRVEVLVHDDGDPVRSASAGRLRVFVNDIEAGFEPSAENEPLSVAVALDLSSSIAGARLRAATAGVSALFSALGPDDRCALLTFSRSVVLHSGWDATCDDAVAALDGLRASGPAALNNALALSLAVLADAPGRPVLVVFTDGADGGSWTRDGWPVAAAAGVAPAIYVVTAPASRQGGSLGGVYGALGEEDLGAQIRFEGRHLTSAPRDLRGLRSSDPFRSLAELAGLSGGGFLPTSGEPDDIEEALAGMPDRIRARLSLQVRLPPDLAPGHHLLRVESEDGDVRHRAGFSIPPP